MWVLYFIPKNLLSFIVGKLVQVRLLKPLGPWTVQWFIKYYNIDISEAKQDSYPSIGDLFVRQLKPGLRPISHASYVHPADSEIVTAHPIESDHLVQTKGKTYSLKEFIKGSDEELSVLRYGWALTYYLCPTDYHRVHSPVEGEIESCRYIPGRLWPVNPWSVENISQLFSVNERVVISVMTARGPVTIVMVGATNVGRITLSFEPKIVTNREHFRQPHRIDYIHPQPIRKGEELGVFHMGSTVVVLAAPGVVESGKTIPLIIKTPLRVRFGESFG